MEVSSQSSSGSVSQSDPNNQVSSDHGADGFQADQTPSSSSPRSRAISVGYWVCVGGTSPPEPKQPQSIDRPRAQVVAMAMMKTTISADAMVAEILVKAPMINSAPITISKIGRTVPTKPAIP